MPTQAVNTFGLMARPIPVEILNKVACTNCRDRPARWDMGQKSAMNYSCSFCFLYELDAIKRQKTHVDWLIRETEKARGVIFKRDATGRLVEEDDADRIAFAIVASNKAVDIRGKAVRSR